MKVTSRNNNNNNYDIFEFINENMTMSDYFYDNNI